MCQLLGMCANKEVNIQFSLREFKRRGTTNPHGWGFAFYKNKKWEIIKKPSSLDLEEITAEPFQYHSKIIIGHVRLASCGMKVHKNTHPFQIGEWVFAHNGTVTQIKKIPGFSLKKFIPNGETDSEYAFCYLLEKIMSEKNLDEIKSISKVLKEESDKIKEYGKFNYLLSNGHFLFAYGDNSLYFTQRKAPFSEVTLRDEGYSVHLEEIKDPDEKAILIATEPLTINENWKKFSGLKIFKDGEEYDTHQSQ